MNTPRALIVLASLIVSGCRQHPSMFDYVKTCESARTRIPIALQMEEVYGDADHFITHFGFDDSPKVWNTEVYFCGRYTLTMQVDIDIDYEANTVKQIGRPKFYLVGVSRIENTPSGSQMASYAGDERWLSEEQWQQIYENHGDFTSAGIQLQSEPVLGFDSFVASIRKDRVPIRLGE